MASVTLDSISKTYRGGVVGVRGVSLEVADGEFVTLVGPSGCGKSTTLNMIAGLEEPTGGRVLIDGVDVTPDSPGARDVAMVFQSYALYPHLTVRRNLAFPLESRGVKRDEIDVRVRETAELLGLEALLERRPRELSGGQRQRVALGRALVRRPRAFLFDEPLSNLDAALRAQMRGELKKLHQRLGATFIYVTHDQTEAMTLSDRVVVMNAGEVQQVAPPRTVYDAPANTFVAGFFGTPRINLVPPSALGLRGDGEVVGLRPEHVEVSQGSAPAGAIPARVDLVEPMGAETWVTADVAGERLVARAPGHLELRSGEAIWLRFQADRLHRFDRASGVRLG